MPQMTTQAIADSLRRLADQIDPPERGHQDTPAPMQAGGTAGGYGLPVSVGARRFPAGVGGYRMPTPRGGMAGMTMYGGRRFAGRPLGWLPGMR